MRAAGHPHVASRARRRRIVAEMGNGLDVGRVGLELFDGHLVGDVCQKRSAVFVQFTVTHEVFSKPLPADRAAAFGGSAGVTK